MHHFNFAGCEPQQLSVHQSSDRPDLAGQQKLLALPLFFECTLKSGKEVKGIMYVAELVDTAS